MSRQKAEENYQHFQEFVKTRDLLKDWPDWADQSGCVMSPAKVCGALDMNTAALRQNPRIRELREKKETELQENGIFLKPRKKPETPTATALSSSRDKQRIKQLEEKNAELREEVEYLKASLRKASIFEEHLLQTGRALPL